MSRSMNVFLSALNTTLPQRSHSFTQSGQGMTLNSPAPSDWEIKTAEDEIKVSNQVVDVTIQISNAKPGEKEKAEKISVNLSQTAEQLTEDIRRRLDVSPERIIGISSADNTNFDLKRSLGENGVTAGSILSVVINADSKKPVTLNTDSEKSENPTGDQSATKRGKEETGGTPTNGKLPFTKPEDIQLLLNIQRLVDRLFKHSNRPWPRDSVGHVIANATLNNNSDFVRSDAGPEFVLSIRSPNSIPRCLNPSTTLVIDGTPIQIRLSPDLKDSLDSWIASESDTSESSVTFEEEEKITISVTFRRGEVISWSMYEEQMSFADLLQQLAFEVEPKPGPQSSLYCTGCGRKLAIEDKEVLLIPVECCRKRSLDLSEIRPKLDETEEDEVFDQTKELRDEETQTEILAYDAQIQSELPRVKSKGIEAIPRLSNKCVPTMRLIVLAQETQAGGESTDAEVQTDAPKPEDNLTERTVNFPIRLKLKGGKKDLWFSARPEDTLGSLVTLLRRSRLLMGVSEVRRGRRSLRTSDTDWRSKSLVVDCGLHPGDELHFDIVTAPSVFTALESPTHNAASVQTVPITPGESDWGHVRRQIQHLLTSQVVACQWGAFHTRQLTSRANITSRHSIFCIEPEKEKSAAYRDEEDGRELDGTCVVSHWSHEFVREGSGLRSSPKMLPVLSVLLHPKLVVVEGKRFKETDVSALFDDQFVALVFGLEHSRSQRWFAELSPGLNFCDSKTGDVFDDAETVVRVEEDEKEMGWKRFLILLRDGDKVPKCIIPEERYVYVRMRHPVVVDVVENRISRVSGSCLPNESVWTMTPDINVFQRKFTKSMRR